MRTKLESEEDFALFETAVERFNLNVGKLMGDDPLMLEADPSTSQHQHKEFETHSDTLVLTDERDTDFVESQMKALR